MLFKCSHAGVSWSLFSLRMPNHYPFSKLWLHPQNMEQRWVHGKYIIKDLTGHSILVNLPSITFCSILGTGARIGRLKSDGQVESDYLRA